MSVSQDTPTSQTRVEFVDSLTRDVKEVKVISEPSVYRRDLPVSYFADLLDAERGEFAPKERLARHAREMELRVNPNRTPGTGGSFSPPLWLIEDFASVPRAKRVLADLIPTFPLPLGVQSVNVPRLLTGTAAAPIADDIALVTTDITDSARTSSVVAIAGVADNIALQLLEQSPRGAHLDWVLFKDLNEAYDEQLEMQLINGSGAGGQLLGLLNLPLPAGNIITFTNATPTASLLIPSLGQLAAQVGNTRRQPLETWLLRTARQAWIVTSEDAQGMPLLVSVAEAPGEYNLVGYPARLDDAIPRNLGAGTNEDTIIGCKPSDMLLWEGEPHTNIFFEPGSGTLSVRLELHRYAASILGRYPSGVAVLHGTGMIPNAAFA